MTRNTDSHSRLWGWIAAAVVGALILVFGALTFTNARIASNTLEEAETLHAAELALAAQDIAMKSIAQLVLLAQDYELGIVGTDALAASATEAERAIAGQQDRFAQLEEDALETLAPSLSEWDEAASAVVELAVAGEGSAASELLVTSLVPAAERLVDAATTERDEQAATVADAQNRVGRVAQLAGFLTAFLLPVGAIIAYRFSVHRQLDVAEAHLDARLEVEKSLGRAKDEFMVNVSRELRTPLASIYGVSEELLEQGFVDPTAAGDLVGLINSESADLARMAEDLLVAAHNTDAPLALEAAPVAMADEINAVLDPFRRRGHIIGGNFGPGTVMGDRRRIRQILDNLVANAFGHGGPTVRVYGDVAGNNYVVSVEDDGEGIPEHIESRLFSRFVHQDDEPLTTGSAGLGLAVAHLLAEAMGGTLEYDKVVGRTSLILSLPIA